MVGWEWRTGHYFFPPILQGIVSIPGFFFVLLTLAIVYMVFASKQLRSEEAAAAALGKTLEQMDGYDKTEHSPITPDDSVQHDVLKTAVNPIRILAVCGSGQGSSMMMKMKIKSYLDKHNIPNTLDSCAVTDYKGKLNEIDIIVASRHLADEIEVGEDKFVLGVQKHAKSKFLWSRINCLNQKNISKPLKGDESLFNHQLNRTYHEFKTVAHRK
ncbi:PTS system ascorbate-specific transporter subunit IICB [Pasteurella multocida]|nr:PTS system ascorbate-specific transporter subunit IICB [Pasteurella multocida]